MSIGEFWTVKKRLWQDQIETIRRYYRKNLRFCFIDLSFGLVALFINPYRTCRKFLQKKEEAEIYAYGETPFTTLELIVKAAEVHPDDIWLELGSGRGKGCFWVSCFTGSSCVGIEWVPQFVRIAKFLKALFRVPRVSFQCISMDEADFTQPTIVYLYGTCLEQSKIDALFEKMKHLKEGTKVITISYPLEGGGFVLNKTFPVEYPWGSAEAYLQIKK
ncbi:MAG: class I SAM-dependent methyltransferase [Chlamydiota bacterium]